MRFCLYLKWGKEQWGKGFVNAESQTNKMVMRCKGMRTQTRTKGTGGRLYLSMLGCGPFSPPAAVKAQWPEGEAGRGLGAKAEPRRASSGPPGLDWPAAPTCSAAERGRVTPSGSASPASGEVRASRLPLHRFVARL